MVSLDRLEIVVCCIEVLVVDCLAVLITRSYSQVLMDTRSRILPAPELYPKMDPTNNIILGLRQVLCRPCQCLTYISFLRKFLNNSPVGYKPLAVWIIDIGQCERVSSCITSIPVPSLV